MIAFLALAATAVPLSGQQQGPVNPQAPAASTAASQEPPDATRPQPNAAPPTMPGTPARPEPTNREAGALTGLPSWLDRVGVGASEEYAPPPVLPSDLPEKIAIPAGTRIPIVLETSLSSEFSHQGEPVTFRTTRAVALGNGLEIPPGVRLQGRVAEVTRRSAFGKSGALHVTVERMVLPGAPETNLRAQLRSADINARGRPFGEGHPAVGREGLVVLSVQGALAGAMLGRKAAGIGAGAGAAIAAVIMMSRRGTDVSVSAGTPFSVRLQQDAYLPAPAVFWAQQDYENSRSGPSADDDSDGVSDNEDGPPPPVLKRRTSATPQP